MSESKRANASQAFKRDMWRPGMSTDDLPSSRDQNMTKAKKHEAAGELGPASTEKKLEQDYEAEMQNELDAEMDAVKAELDRLSEAEKAGQEVDRQQELYWMIKAFDLLGEEPPQDMIDEYEELSEVQEEAEEVSPDQIDALGQQRVFKRAEPTAESKAKAEQLAAKHARQDAERQARQVQPIATQPSRTPAQMFSQEDMAAMRDEADEQAGDTTTWFERPRQEAAAEPKAEVEPEPAEAAQEAEQAPDWCKQWMDFLFEQKALDPGKVIDAENMMDVLEEVIKIKDQRQLALTQEHVVELTKFIWDRFSQAAKKQKKENAEIMAERTPEELRSDLRQINGQLEIARSRAFRFREQGMRTDEDRERQLIGNLEDNVQQIQSRLSA